MSPFYLNTFVSMYTLRSQLWKMHRAKWKQSELTASRTRPPWRIPLVAAWGSFKPLPGQCQGGSHSPGWQAEPGLPWTLQGAEPGTFPLLLRVFQHRGLCWAQLCSHPAGTGEAAGAARTEAIGECHGAVPAPSNPTWNLFAIHGRQWAPASRVIKHIPCARSRHCTASAPLLTQQQRIFNCTMKKEPRRNWSLLNEDTNTKFEKNYQF